MIFEPIFNAIKSVVLYMIGLLPTMDFMQLPQNFMTWFTDIMSASAYFLPLADFLIMFGIWLFVVNFEIIWKAIQRVWDALPFT